MSNSILRGFSIGAKVTSLLLVTILPLWYFVTIYTIIALITNSIDRHTVYKTKMVMLQYPWLMYIQVVTLPIVGYSFYHTVHYLF